MKIDVHIWIALLSVCFR